jgi:hypothetical protein
MRLEENNSGARERLPPARCDATERLRFIAQSPFSSPELERFSRARQLLHVWHSGECSPQMLSFIESSPPLKKTGVRRVHSSWFMVHGWAMNYEPWTGGIPPSLTHRWALLAALLWGEGRGFHTEHAFFIPLQIAERLHGIPATFVALIDVTIRAKNTLQLLTFLPASSNAATARH